MKAITLTSLSKALGPVTDGAFLLEGPTALRGRLFVLAIYHNNVLELDPRTGAIVDTHVFDSAVGSLAFDSDGYGHAGTRDGILWFDPEDTDERDEYVESLIDPSIGRPNDGKATPGGNLLVGTLDDNEFDRPLAALHRIDRSTGEAEVLIPGVTISNGMCWSPDGTRFFYTDSRRGGFIREYAWDSTADTLADGPNNFRSIEIPTIKFPIDGGDSLLDGCCIIRDGSGFKILWTAWGKRKILVIDPDSGKVEDEIEVPFNRPTCCDWMCGVDGKDRLIITSEHKPDMGDKSEEEGLVAYLDFDLGRGVKPHIFHPEFFEDEQEED